MKRSLNVLYKALFRKKEMFARLNYLKNSTFPIVKTTVDTLIDVRNETSKHHFLKSVKYITLLSDANVPVRFRAQQRATYSLTTVRGQQYRSYNVSLTLYQADLRITNHRRQKSPSSFKLLSSVKTRIKRLLG